MPITQITQIPADAALTVPNLRVMQIIVSQSLPEICVVFGWREHDGAPLKLHGRRKAFRSEDAKLGFLAAVQAKGFARFGKTERRVDAEAAVLGVMASVQGE